MKTIYTLIDKLIYLGAYVAGVLILLTTVMTFTEVIMRSFLHKPTIWATELSIYAIIGSCFLGCAYAIRAYSHITVDLLINNVNDTIKTIFAYITNSLGLVFSIVFTVYSYFHTIDVYHLQSTSNSLLRIPMYMPNSLLFIGGILMCLAFILQIIDGGIHRGGENI